ncbi:hypothetical protein [Uliginosibacterium sp. 31-12]|uniref:hypothetical protein n=1 Tax=Uliginosibacterium sp. 31-12 TaxID=3062781 RepID=UPI0026E272AD|nr:hypothetical protein [Uliginosibacterium sp. 31-12]MDO6388478.1 hypothetical protein [Uliginosibacterium sp. 31-12]
MYERSTGGPGDDENISLKKRLPPGFDPYAEPGTYFKPNSFSLKERLANSALALFLIFYGVWGLYLDDLWIPGKRSTGIHLHGQPAWLMFLAFVCGAAVLLATVIDHYDNRNNEERYITFKKAAKISGWVFFVAAMLLHLTIIFRS